MKAQLLIGQHQVQDTLYWPDTFNPDEVKDAALTSPGNYYDISGDRIAVKPQLPQPVPYEFRVLNDAGEVTYRWDTKHLAESLGKQGP